VLILALGLNAIALVVGSARMLSLKAKEIWEPVYGLYIFMFALGPLLCLGEALGGSSAWYLSAVPVCYLVTLGPVYRFCLRHPAARHEGRIAKAPSQGNRSAGDD